MFWSRIAGVYDLVEYIYNGKVNADVSPNEAERYKHTDKRGKAIGDGLVNAEQQCREGGLPSSSCWL